MIAAARIREAQTHTCDLGRHHLKIGHVGRGCGSKLLQKPRGGVVANRGNVRPNIHTFRLDIQTGGNVTERKLATSSARIRAKPHAGLEAAT